MASITSAPSQPKPAFPRLSSIPGGDHFYSRDSSPSPCSTPDGSRSSSQRRPSFGSIKEDTEDGIAQSFVDTQQAPAPQAQDQERKVERLTQMQHAPDFCCPCGGFLGWKQIRLGGRSLSRSYSDLRGLGNLHAKGWAWEAQEPETMKLLPPKTPEVEVDVLQTPPGTSPLERLPRRFLIKSSLTLRSIFHQMAMPSERGLGLVPVSIPHIARCYFSTRRWDMVRRLDFSHFTSVGLGRTKQMNAEIQNLTSKTLLQCLELLPNLRECLLQEHLEGDISVEVIRKLFMGMPNLRAVDFCGCSTQAFSGVFQEAVIGGPALSMTLPNLKCLSLHECSTIPAPMFDYLLPRLVNLTHLDLTHTQVNDSALVSIPETARISHLSLSRCTRLRPCALVEFLTTHPSVKESLVYLNLLTDPTRFRLLEENDVSALLPNLPDTLRSLNLGGAKITSDHVPHLVPMTKHLEELGLSSADLSVADVNAFFGRYRDPVTGVETDAPSTLCYLDLAKVPQMTIGAIFNTSTCSLLSNQSYPLQVVEFSDKIITPLRERAKTHRTSVGWTVRDLGRRGWYVREPSSMPHEPHDDGARYWKMGARWWGMRKIPMAVGEVGGLYGHYMFKK
ncbi:hypothetical protein PDIDSM_7456 [Penicillium digitatum]|nr:hypothetical protein PDIDSM_7456 [Penicillium digitatum]